MSSGGDARLIRHPESRGDAALDCRAHVDWIGGGRLIVNFTIAGRLTDIVMPSPATPMRRDGLWQTTCLELFIAGQGASYREFNFAPSREWAAYMFDGYRSGMRELDIQPPTIAHFGDDRVAAFAIALDLGADIPPGPLHIGLSAIIEQRDGSKSWWALVHPPGAPDFHHRDCFARAVEPAFPS